MPIKDSIVVSSTLPTLRLDLLRAGDDAESKRLLGACRTQGFFYLDLTSDAILCRQWKDMLGVMKQYFEQPLEVKMQDAYGSDNHGYEPMGTEEGPKPKTRDGYESLKISRREFLKGSTDLSTSVEAHSSFFFDFMRTAHDITLMILERLSTSLDLKGSSRFEAYHADPGPSFSTLGLLRYPKHSDKTPTSVGHNKHTDVGSLTFLLAAQWGLQFLSPETKRWEFLEPRSGHAVINVGDSLRFPSNGELASVVHRVVPLRTTQEEDRYSIAYFLRLNDDVRFTDLKGKTWTAKGWHDFKFDVFKSPSTLDPSKQFLTGMMEENDLLVGSGNNIVVAS
ncbi:Clavaminate synthase-like protein [Pleomassaria siparia CBS 279.74]|uniref:Clavaminate synthase-like protein n=1 Tax=Pleomassaria siparia CBS 279.74 TaxID=1314801 RepID=A0A6G1KKD7_9PLEO|nr:Clavaminate synthase-like protein [Pleomassaria siparia CBS 279.74]